ncbi:nucleotidyltransferase domain protein [Janthinobacterium agaricidamnosum NBRC 102515 = DSM 9628]|uniref:Nucleotidyltransferase domain protein n=2 Tax=Janthinobacterium agaricidamnosum TaxID=55508 RepID=W0V1B8_9BURK|nr:nucleotidyltransferase domain protein [Janthinobacterium agaricidamnosum NBRC 102515 = DSM 9628]
MGMMTNAFDDTQLLRSEIAAAAARLIAQDGADYATAKRKAARQILGDVQPALQVLPDNTQIEHEVRLYNALFLSDSQPARLFQLRTIALQVMQGLQQFHPLISGAVLNGTAGPHDEIYLQLFAESAKEVQIFLLNKKMTIDISETPHFKGPRYDAVETVSFLWQKEGVHAALYELDDLRGARKLKADGKMQRTDMAGLRALLSGAPDDSHNIE